KNPTGLGGGVRVLLTSDCWSAWLCKARLLTGSPYRTRHAHPAAITASTSLRVVDGREHGAKRKGPAAERQPACPPGRETAMDSLAPGARYRRSGSDCVDRRR